MILSPNGVKLIQSFESLRLLSYQDEKGVWTNGWGHTGPDVTPAQTIDQNQAFVWFAKDVAWAERAVGDLSKVPLNQNEFDALVSLVFNIGRSRLAKSKLLSKLNAGDRNGAAAEFLTFRLVDGQPSDGLYKRRWQEAKLFTSRN